MESEELNEFYLIRPNFSGDRIYSELVIILIPRYYRVCDGTTGFWRIYVGGLNLG